MECRKCCVPLTSPVCRITDSGMQSSTISLECPRKQCNRKNFFPVWSLTAIIDDGSAQVRMFAEWECALKLLKQCTQLTLEMISLIESACLTVEGGLCYLVNIPPESSLK